MRQCSKCGIEKPFDEFYRVGRSASLRRRCKACFNDQEKARRKVSDYQAEYSKRYSERISSRKAKSRMTIAVRAGEMIAQARRRARNGGDTQFNISVAFVEVVLELGRCQKSGVSFDLAPHPSIRVNPFAPSIDKINPFGFYTNDNIQIVCDMYNRGKGQNTDAQFIAFCKRVAEFNS